MHKYALLILIFVITGCAGNNLLLKTYQPENIIHYSMLDKLESAALLKDYVVYLNEGDAFPLQLLCDTDIFGIADTTINLTAKRKLFFMVKMPENLTEEELSELERLDKEKISAMSESDKKKLFANYMLYLSNDAEVWAPINDIQAIKKVFNTKGGTITFGMGMGTQEGLWSYLDVKEMRD